MEVPSWKSAVAAWGLYVNNPRHRRFVAKHLPQRGVESPFFGMVHSQKFHTDYRQFYRGPRP